MRVKLVFMIFDLATAALLRLLGQILCVCAMGDDEVCALAGRYNGMCFIHLWSTHPGGGATSRKEKDHKYEQGEEREGKKSSRPLPACVFHPCDRMRSHAGVRAECLKQTLKKVWLPAKFGDTQINLVSQVANRVLSTVCCCFTTAGTSDRFTTPLSHRAIILSSAQA